MAGSRIPERITAWEAAGLIDGPTAARLREDEAARVAAAPAPAASAFGPTPTVAEVLGYVGAGFLLAAWYVLMTNRVAGLPNAWGTWALTFGVAAGFAAFIGAVLQNRDERGGRAAGVFFAVAAGNAIGLGFNLGTPLFGDTFTERFLLGAAAGLGVGILVRWRHPALLSQATLLVMVGVAGAALGEFLRARVLPAGLGSETGTGMALDFGLWIAVAVVMGLLALLETDAGDAAWRRASLSRFGAGLVAVVASGAILTRSGPKGPVGEVDYYQEWGRILEPIVADAVIAGVALVLLWLAFRRGAAAYLYPGALGIVIALSDLNGSYVVDQVGTGVALLIEGLLILGAGLAADRLRRRLGAPSSTG